MENKNSNGLVVAFIIVLVVAVIGIGGTLYFYNRSLNVNNKEDSTQKNINESESNEEDLDKKASENENNDSSNGLNELKKIAPFSMGYDELGMLMYMEEELKYLPNKDKSYNVKDLLDSDISMVVWKYIANNTQSVENSSLDKSQVDNFIQKYFGLQNYKVKPMKIEGNNIFGLEEKNQKYVISIVATEYSLISYRAKGISYDVNSKEIKVDFDELIGDMSIKKSKEGTAIFKVTENEVQSIFTLLRVEYK